MSERPRQGNHAVVIGAGMAGLMSARVLADFYASVTLLERDHFPETDVPRSGVPQGRHAHALLAAGQQAIEALFPGLMSDLVEHGAPRGTGRFFAGGGYLSQSDDRPKGLMVSRPCLEAAVRCHLLRRDNVKIRQGVYARGLVASADQSCITGVRIRPAHQGKDEEAVAADLVVDASGRGSHAAEWISTLGFDPPETELIEVNMGYSTRFYRREPEHLNGDLIINIAPTPSLTRACGMVAQEGDRWIVTLAGYFGDYPPTDDAGYLEFARGLPTSDVYDLITQCVPLSDPTPYRFLANQRRRYERLTRFPNGFLVIGDAICSYTPIYGQGMSVAGQEALVLRAALAEGYDRLALRFFKRAGRIVDMAWTITAGGDRALSPVLRDRRPPARVIRWYLGRLQYAARRDPQLAAAFMTVANLLVPASTLLRPRIAWRVLSGNLGRGNHATDSPSQAMEARTVS